MLFKLMSVDKRGLAVRKRIIVKPELFISKFTSLWKTLKDSIAGLVQGKRNSIANALELRLPCTNPSL